MPPAFRPLNACARPAKREDAMRLDGEDDGARLDERLHVLVGRLAHLRKVEVARHVLERPRLQEGPRRDGRHQRGEYKGPGESPCHPPAWLHDHKARDGNEQERHEDVGDSEDRRSEGAAHPLPE